MYLNLRVPILCQTTRHSGNSYFKLPWAREGLSKLDTKSKNHKGKERQGLTTQKPKTNQQQRTPSSKSNVKLAEKELQSLIQGFSRCGPHTTVLWERSFTWFLDRELNLNSMNLGITAGRWESSFALQITPCKWLRPKKSGPGMYIYKIMNSKTHLEKHE